MPSMNDIRFYAINNRGRFKLLATTEEAARTELANDIYLKLYECKLIKETREVIATHSPN